MVSPQITVNRMRTPDGTILQSKSGHDYVTHLDKNGKRYMLDGGFYYVRSSGNGDEEYLTLTVDSPFEEIRKYFTWGTRGKDGTSPLSFVFLKDMSTEHIKAILETQGHIRNTFVEDLFLKELDFRK